MSRVPEIKFDLPDQRLLERLLGEPLPLGLRAYETRKTFHRDVYLDTEDRTLKSRGVTVWLRYHADDRRVLTVRLPSSEGASGATDQVFAATTGGTELNEILREPLEPIRRLRAFVDPLFLAAQFDIETARVCRTGRAGILFGRKVEFCYDVMTVRAETKTQNFRELVVRGGPRDGRLLERLSDALRRDYGLRAILTDVADRAERRRRAMETEVLAREVRQSRQLTVLAFSAGRLAVIIDETSICLPTAEGQGEEACRDWMRRHLGSAGGLVRRLGTATPSANRPLLEVWLADDMRSAGGEIPGLRWVSLDEIMSRVGSPLLRDAATLAALAVAARSDLLPARRSDAMPIIAGVGGEGTSALTDLELVRLPEASLDAAQPVPDQFINENLSWIEFNRRVLDLAEDPNTPLLAQCGFLAIFSSNLDEFFMIRVGGLKHALAVGATHASADGLTPQEELDAISIRLAPLLIRQQRCYQTMCVPELKRRGISVLRWEDLTSELQEQARRYFDDQIFPLLTPQAMTQAPGHPFPHLPHLALSLAVRVRDGKNGPSHFAQVKIPSGVNRFVPLEEGAVFVPIEDIVSNNLQALYPGRVVEEAYPFRVTRAADMEVDESAVPSLMYAIEEGVKARRFGAVVRVEVDARMPVAMRDLLRRELSFEGSDAAAAISNADIVDARHVVDLGGLTALAALPRPELQYPAFTPAAVFASDRSIFDQIRERDTLVHHPYESFEQSVERLIAEAAADPDVIAIRLTLYRSGQQSSIIEALTSAAQAGKDVSVFVELKARFDEERNIHWARTLERAGIHVITGLVKLKTHAKVTLVVRREGDEIRRYVHLGTGNYNPTTARRYTDLGLFSCDEQLGSDLNDLFNALTGSSRPPSTPFRALIVAPTYMLESFIGLIDREVEHVRAGRPGRIRAKLNGLADREVIAALYRAAQVGVEIDLVVRGICALRPGVPGLSEGIRVYSILGRFLEHARIFHFGNGGDDEYLLGSADWRPRNLRRRVEVVTPIYDPRLKHRLDAILQMELDDPFAWQMRSDGAYVRPPPPVGVDAVSAQDRLTAP